MKGERQMANGCLLPTGEPVAVILLKRSCAGKMPQLSGVSLRNNRRYKRERIGEMCMLCADVFKKIDELNGTYRDVWEQACTIESPTGYKAGVDAVGSFFAKMAEERGWEVEYSRQEVSGDVVCITMNPHVDAAPLCVSGHIDTVHPVGSFGTPAVRRDAEKIYGPGVTDCKGGVVAGFYAMDALWQCGYDKRPVRLLIQTDEEVSSMQSGKSTINYICEKAKDAVAFLNLETSGVGKTCLTRKGVIAFRFCVTGRAGHSSRCVTEGANAVVDAAYKMIELDKLKDDDGITCNCAIVSGGTVANSIPRECTFTVEFRYANAEQYAWLCSYVEELAATEHVSGCSCTYEVISERVSMEPNEKNLALLSAANKILAENGLPELKAIGLRGGSDAADATAYGIPCLDSLGTRGAGSHTLREFAYLESLAEAARRIVAIAYGI